MNIDSEGRLVAPGARGGVAADNEGLAGRAKEYYD